jgi:hypothetical protein
MKEIKDAHFTLVRSKKKLPKIKSFRPSQKLDALKRMPSAPLDTGDALMSPIKRQGESGAQNESSSETGDSSPRRQV